MNENWKALAEMLLFDFGKSVFGKNAGGLIVKLLRQRGIDGARRAIVAAQNKQDPREYGAAALKEQLPPDVQIGEVIKGWVWDGGKWKKQESASGPAA
jgi:hypothetical protein